MAGRECAEMIQAVSEAQKPGASITAIALKYGVSRHGLHAALRRRRVSGMALAAAKAVRAGADETKACFQFEVSPGELKQALRAGAGR